MRRISLSLFFLVIITNAFAQVDWENVDVKYGPLPASVHVYFTDKAIDTAPFRAYYLIADLKEKKLKFSADTAHDRRLTPLQFFEKDQQPLVVLNCTFFSYQTNRSLNIVMNEGKLLGYNVHTIPGRGKDTFTYRHPFCGAIGINKKREADIAWIYTDSLHRHAYARQTPLEPLKDSFTRISHGYIFGSLPHYPGSGPQQRKFYKWNMRTAVGGGPVLIQNGEIRISNNEELKFGGKAINDKHPRTAMGYTANGKLIILVVEGRTETGHGASLPQEAQILKDLGCIEALNLDGGGSSCLLVNGKETIKVSDKEGQRPVPSVFIIRKM
jgi:hypothetical protein